MRNCVKWYDPICYQFSFYMLETETESWNPVEATKSFFEELIPYYHLWMTLQGSVMVESTTSAGTSIRIAKNSDALLDDCNVLLGQQSHMLHSYKIIPVPDKTQSQFAASDKTLSKEWRQEVLQYTDMKNSTSLSASQKAAWLCQMLNCPTDNLEGLYFPQKCFESQEIPLKVFYGRFDYPQSLLPYNDKLKKNAAFPIGQDSNDVKNLHYIHISLPRYMIKHADKTFDLQQKWEERLLLLCNTFISSFGCIKMDRYKKDCVSPLLTGNGCFAPNFGSGIPDVAWGLCLTQHQAERLIKFNEQYCLSLFDKVLPLGNGHLYLRLTPDVSVVSKNKAKELWRLIFPQLCIAKYAMNSLGDVPISFRLGIDASNLQVNEYGYYQIIR